MTVPKPALAGFIVAVLALTIACASGGDDTSNEPAPPQAPVKTPSQKDVEAFLDHIDDYRAWSDWSDQDLLDAAEVVCDGVELYDSPGDQADAYEDIYEVSHEDMLAMVNGAREWIC